jgi:hypothetical protein
MIPPKSHIYLSEQNLLTLLSKLNRLALGEDTACTIIKYQQTGPYKQTMKAIQVTAVPDGMFYNNRPPGEMHPAEEHALFEARVSRYLKKELVGT